MAVVELILKIVLCVVCVALTFVVLLQEGRTQGLGTISGAADTYWGQNKGRSMEGALVKITRVLAGLFIIVAALLGLSIFK